MSDQDSQRDDDSRLDDSRLERATGADGPSLDDNESLDDTESLEDAATREEGAETPGAGASISRDQTRVEAASISSTYSQPRTKRDDEELDEIRGYRVIRLLGEGGMGEVFEAEQVGAVRRRVAIKVIKRGMDSRRIVNRFEAERQALAMMDHPGIARIFDAGLTEDHRPFFAMEFVEGVPITEYCDEHRLSIRRRIELFVQVCRAVQHAHLKGIIHRDLKPTNILVTLQDGEPVPKVIDFGLAKAMTEPLTEREMKTEMGQLLGTMEYMSPEQADLGSVDIDTRTDVYSLGVVLYQLLAGTLPFESEELMQGGYWRALRRIREEEAERPSRKSSTATDPEKAAEKRHLHDSRELTRCLAGDLDWIVLKAVAKDRAERYETVNGLALDLERHLNDQPVTAASPTLRYRLGKFVRRHRVGFATSVLLLAMIIGFGVVMAIQAKRIAEERDRANLEAATAEESLEFMVDLFEVVDPDEGRGSTITAREVLDSGAMQLQRSLNDQPLVRARLLDTIGQVYLSLGLEDRAEPLVQDALEIRDRELGRPSAEVAVSLRRMAEVALAQGESERGESVARESVTLMEEAGVAGSPEHAEALRILGWVLAKQDRYDEAETIFRQSLEIRRATLPPDHLEVAESLYDLGTVSWHQRRLERTKELLNEALSIIERRFGSKHIQIASILNLLGGVALAEGQLEEGEKYLRRGLRITEDVVGSDSRRLASDLNTLALLLDSQAQYEEAEELIKRSLSIYERTVGKDHREYATALGNLAWIHYRQQNYEQAESYYQEALDVFLDTIGPSHSLVATLQRDFAVMLIDMGSLERASEHIQQACETRVSTYSPDHVEVADCYYVKAIVAHSLGNLTHAFSQARRALQIQEKALGENHPIVLKTKKLLAEIQEFSES